MTDENLLTSAKLREQIEGRLQSHDSYQKHVGLLTDPADRAAFAFASASITPNGELPNDVSETKLGGLVLETNVSHLATEAIKSGDGSTLSHLVGVTEQDLDASSITLPARLNQYLDNDDAPAFVIGAGNPETGKTNTALLLTELRKAFLPDLMVLANFDSSITDMRVSNAHDLYIELLRNRQTPKAVVLDECSTHFDARTYRIQVATQWTPLAKRFAKIHVDHNTLITHTGKDIHPEAKRLATLPFYKEGKKEVSFYAEWGADADSPSSRRFSGQLEHLEATNAKYDPDDSAPWAWNLEPEIFAVDLGWDDLLDELESGRFRESES